ncbi:ribbon-helix-helix protein, CopG family [Candidatus Woesearchaeota archaeon]|nr:ribbon-helix-helix protein, CopG family [Candidatus Woesearchaeota archaeon]
MKATIVLDEETEKELNELKASAKASKSRLIREAVRELYLKEKRAKENLLFFVDMYNEGAMTKDSIFLLLPRKDAEAVIIGSKAGKEAAEIAKKISG